MILFRAEPGLKFIDKITYPEINIPKDQITFITGDSGCGKSTLLKLINRTAIPSEGQIICNVEDIDNLSILEYRKEVTLIPQQVFLLEKSIAENFTFYYEMREETPPSQEEMKKFLKIAELDFSVDADCRKLSGGERKRVFLAIFLSFSRKIILLDEPTASLDYECGRRLLSNLRNFTKENEITVICVCHDRSLTEEFADKIISLEALN